MFKYLYIKYINTNLFVNNYEYRKINYIIQHSTNAYINVLFINKL